MNNSHEDFSIIFKNLEDLQITSQQGSLKSDEIDYKELDEIRVLREIVLEVQTEPLILYSST